MEDTYHCKVCESSTFCTLVSNIKDWEYGFQGEFSYLECGYCKSIQIHPFPSLEELKKAYEIDYHGYATPNDKGYLYKVLFKMVEALSIKELKKFTNKDSKVLDVGCGIGLFLEKLQRLGVTQLTGIDFSAVAIRGLKERGIDGYQGTFLDFEAKVESFDLIVMNNYLEHTLTPVKELEKAIKLLKPGGRIIGELPNFAALDQAIFGRYWGGNHVPRHTIQFSPFSLRRLLENIGFESVDLSYPINTSHFALSIQNYCQRNRTECEIGKGLIHGRASYYSLLMFAIMPINLILKMAKKTGFLKFNAVKVKK
jgi:2-polyprenyl-3-methyl-5-hydroxy-6-metoxy-1,4-benzoquinol methylase